MQWATLKTDQRNPSGGVWRAGSRFCVLRSFLCNHETIRCYTLGYMDGRVVLPWVDEEDVALEPARLTESRTTFTMPSASQAESRNGDDSYEAEEDTAETPDANNGRAAAGNDIPGTPVTRNQEAGAEEVCRTGCAIC